MFLRETKIAERKICRSHEALSFRRSGIELQRSLCRLPCLLVLPLGKERLRLTTIRRGGFLGFSSERWMRTHHQQHQKGRSPHIHACAG
jgi:hypothetical protein